MFSYNIQYLFFHVCFLFLVGIREDRVGLDSAAIKLYDHQLAIVI